MRTDEVRRGAGLLGAAALLVTVSACGMPHDRTPAPQSAVPPATVALPGQQAHVVSAPGEFEGRTVTPDLLVYAPDTLPEPTRRRVERLPGVARALPLSVAQVALGGRTLTVAAADPARFRRFTPRAVAATDEVWRRVAGGEVTVAPSLGEEFETPDGHLLLGQRTTDPRARIAAYASLPPRIDAVLNQRWGRALGMPAGNALLVSTGSDPAAVAERLRSALGLRAGVLLLVRSTAGSGPQTAMLTGGSVAESVGSFSFVPHDDGTVEVEPAWVAANIRTEEVPVLGRVTCHRVMLPQLRGALQEVVDRGLADRIDPGEYGGCFHPRYIGNDPRRGLSLHTWGIALDLNVADNQRGTVGELDRDVVNVFKRWGFAWGGDWAYTDPMHFELAALVQPR